MTAELIQHFIRRDVVHFPADCHLADLEVHCQGTEPIYAIRIVVQFSADCHLADLEVHC